MNSAAPWVGSRAYVAPEAIHCGVKCASVAPVTFKADVWSAGVVVFEALAGSRRGIRADDALSAGSSWSLPELPADVEGAVAFSLVLRLMLTVDPEARLDCSSLLVHPAMAELRLLADNALGIDDDNDDDGAPTSAASSRSLAAVSTTLRPGHRPFAESPKRVLGRRTDPDKSRAYCLAGDEATATRMRGVGSGESICNPCDD